MGILTLEALPTKPAWADDPQIASLYKLHAPLYLWLQVRVLGKHVSFHILWAHRPVKALDTMMDASFDIWVGRQREPVAMAGKLNYQSVRQHRQGRSRLYRLVDGAQGRAATGVNVVVKIRPVIEFLLAMLAPRKPVLSMFHM